MFATGILFKANYESAADVVVNQGGTWSGKTYSILQTLFTYCVQQKGIIVTVAGQDIPNLKSGALRDAETIVAESHELATRIASYNKTDRIFLFHNGSKMEFKSYEDGQDAKSGKRDYLFVNEANGIPYKVYEELALRTRSRIYIDYNPNAEFWVHEKVLPFGAQMLISDHRHNPFVPQKMRDKIEGLKEKDEELWKVYARGMTGKIEGLVFRNWIVVRDIPTEAKLIANGLDFGFTNDPTASLSVFMQNGELWLDEIMYQHELTNDKIADRLKEVGKGRDEIVCDSAEPKSIAELKGYGINAKPAEKGADSIRQSIDILKRYKINVTERSVNLRKELMSYKWATTKTGEPLNEPVGYLDHLIAALRYVALNKLKKSNGGSVSII